MNAQKKLTKALLALLLVTCLPGCATKFKTFTRYNGTDSKVIVESLTGVYTFGKGDYRSSFTDFPVWPDQVQSEVTWGPYIEIELPIEIKWHYEQSPGKSFTTRLVQIPGLPSKVRKIRAEGTLVLYFGADREWHVEWLKGEERLVPSQLRELARKKGGTS